MSETPSLDAPVEDALSLLHVDHDEVADLFARYESLVAGDASSGERRNLAEEICTMLTVHAAIEEEIFYPAVRDATGNDVEVDEALAEHDKVKEIVSEILTGDPVEPAYDHMVQTLAELVAEHVLHEESELFAAARESSLDLEELGMQMSERQEVRLSTGEG